MTIDLSPLRHAGDDPAFDPKREAALLGAFDAAQREPRASGRAPSKLWLQTAAALVIAAAATWMLRSRPARIEQPLLGAHAAPQTTMALIAPEHVAGGTFAPAPAPTPRTLTPTHHAPSPSAFVPWPDSDTLPPFESGQLVRIDLPTPMAISLGLTPRALYRPIVRADIIVGQDGFARAVRIAPVP